MCDESDDTDVMTGDCGQSQTHQAPLGRAYRGKSPVTVKGISVTEK